jgi:hypothetical protein
VHLPHISDWRVQGFPVVGILMFCIMYTNLHHHISIYFVRIIMNNVPEPLAIVDHGDGPPKIVRYLEWQPVY